jgi:hypothetical protein
MSNLIILGIGGDSITGCTSVGICYPYQGLNVNAYGDCGVDIIQAACTYYATIGSVNVIAKNLGISGTRLLPVTGPQSMTNIAQNFGDPMVTPSGGQVSATSPSPRPTRKYIYSLLAGSNDGCLGSPNNTPAGFAINVATFVNARKMAGWDKVIIGTVLPRNDMGGPLSNSNRLSYNAIIRDPVWLAANNVDGLFDIGLGVSGGGTIMGDITTCSDSTYFNSDQIHPKTAGHAIIAPIWLATLTTAIASL